jgi:hypothetical protein
MAHAYAPRRTAGHVVAPPLAPSGFLEILQDADALLALMGSEPLGVVADLADALTVSANGAGAQEIAQAASAVSRIASGPQPVALAGAMRDLTAAIIRAQHAYHIECQQSS